MRYDILPIIILALSVSAPILLILLIHARRTLAAERRHIAALIDAEQAARKNRAQLWADRNRAEASAAASRACLVAIALAWPTVEVEREVGATAHGSSHIPIGAPQ